MKVVNLGTANSLASTIDGLVRPGRRSMAVAKRFINAVCILRSGGKPYVKVTIKNESTTYRGRKGNDLTFHAVHSGGRTFMEIHDSKSSSAKFGARLNSGAGKPTIQDLVDKANSNAVWSEHFVFTVIRNGSGIAFDADFDGPGNRFKGGRGR